MLQAPPGKHRDATAQDRGTRRRRFSAARGLTATRSNPSMRYFWKKYHPPPPAAKSSTKSSRRMKPLRGLAPNRNAEIRRKVVILLLETPEDADLLAPVPDAEKVSDFGFEKANHGLH